ncbi:transcriptional repressor [Moorellaceae bacterium AZ2]
MKRATRRMTKQKRIILEILRSTTSHPTADWIYAQARKVLPDISLGTVYRNLNVLKEDGEIMELNYGSTYSRYDGNPQNHYHFVCINCGAVHDVDMPVLPELEKRAEEAGVGDVFYHRLEFYGLCPRCRKDKML